MLAEDLLNPFQADAVCELPHPVQDEPLWTEFCYFFCYDRNSGTGLTVHAGREPEDTAVWRATIVVYLPDGELLVAKYSGRDGHPRGAGAGPWRATCVEPMRLWAIDFDGSMQRTSRVVATREAHRDAPGELVSFHLLFEGAAPFWDMHQDAGKMNKQSWGSAHFEQICKVRGQLTIAGREIAFHGAGVRDHSSGPRDYAPVIGNFWMNVFFPKSGTAIMAQLTRSANLDAEIRQGYIFRNDGSPLEVVKLKSGPEVVAVDTPDNSVAADPLADPAVRSFIVELETKAGVERIECELVHSGPTTYLSPSDELLGTAIGREGLQLTESPVLVRWNGEEGLGVRERIVPLRALKV